MFLFFRRKVTIERKANLIIFFPLFCLFTNVILTLSTLYVQEKPPQGIQGWLLLARWSSNLMCFEQDRSSLISPAGQSALCEHSVSLQWGCDGFSSWHLHCQSQVSALSWESPAFDVSSDWWLALDAALTLHFFGHFIFTAVSWGNSESFLLNPVKSQALFWLVFVPDLCL